MILANECTISMTISVSFSINGKAMVSIAASIISQVVTNCPANINIEGPNATIPAASSPRPTPMNTRERPNTIKEIFSVSNPKLKDIRLKPSCAI